MRAYQRRTVAADALIAGAYLAGTNTRRVRRALGALFGGAVGKDTVSRVRPGSQASLAVLKPSLCATVVQLAWHCLEASSRTYQALRDTAQVPGGASQALRRIYLPAQNTFISATG